MQAIRGTRALLVALAVAAVGAGCAAQPPPAAPAAPPPAAAAPPAAADGHGGARGGSSSGRNRSSAALPALPADWPAAVSLPPGWTVQGSTGGGGRWSVLMIAPGSARDVLTSTMGFYTAAGYTAESDSVAYRAPYRLTVAVENRGHSNTETNVTMAVALQ
jgi:hypothetical protein